MVRAASAAAVSGATVAVEVAATSATEVAASSESASAASTAATTTTLLDDQNARLLVGSAPGASALAALSREMPRLLAVVADLGAARVAVASRRTAAVSVVAATVAPAVGSAVLRRVVLVRLLAELHRNARTAKVTVVQLLNCLVRILLILVIYEGVVALNIMVSLLYIGGTLKRKVQLPILSKSSSRSLSLASLGRFPMKRLISKF